MAATGCDEAASEVHSVGSVLNGHTRVVHQGGGQIEVVVGGA